MPIAFSHRWRGAVVFLVAVAALIAAGCAESKPKTMLELANEAGGGAPAAVEAAPDFSVVTFAGATFTLSDHLATDGRPVFLNLWASWCGPCRVEMPEIDRAAGRNPQVAFIGVAVQDDEDSARRFADEIGVSYALGFDESGEVVKAYAPIGLPATYFISSDGILVERIFGPLTGAQIEEKLEAHFGGQ